MGQSSRNHHRYGCTAHPEELLTGIGRSAPGPWRVMSVLNRSVFKCRLFHLTRHQAVTSDPLRLRTDEGHLQRPLWTIMKLLFCGASWTSQGISTEVSFNGPPLHPPQGQPEEPMHILNHSKKIQDENLHKIKSKIQEINNRMK